MPGMSLRDLNRKLSIISRIVIHPKYRSIGLGAYLIRETLERVGTPYIEMVAVMAKYNPFAERAGMRRVCLHEAPKQAVNVSDVLRNLGFDLQLLTSERYVRSKLVGLEPSQMVTLRGSFTKNDHPRFRRTLHAQSRKAYGTTQAYREGIEKADLEHLASLIKVTGILLQTKAYLFWSRDPTPSCA
jgi:hypothetical protein